MKWPVRTALRGSVSWWFGVDQSSLRDDRSMLFQELGADPDIRSQYVLNWREVIGQVAVSCAAGENDSPMHIERQGS